MPIKLTALFVFVGFLLGTYVGTATTEHWFAERCVMGDRIRIGSIEVQCPAMAPGWRERR